MSVVRVFKRIFELLKIYGFQHTYTLINIVGVWPFRMRLMPFYLRAYLKLRHMRLTHFIDKEIQVWQKKNDLIQSGKGGYVVSIYELALDESNLATLEKQSKNCREVVIAEIDQDGFLLSHFGTIHGLPQTTKEQFKKRNRSKVTLVATNKQLGIKKEFKYRKRAFLNEITALYTLRETGCNIPSILDIDFDNLTITISFILGKVLREELAKHGAVLRDRDVKKSSDFKNLSQNEIWLKCIQEGKAVLFNVIDEQFIEGLFCQLRKVHDTGIILNDIKYGNIVIEQATGLPYWIDFDHADFFPKIGKEAYSLLRDKDIERFNLFFDTDKLTRKTIQKKIESYTRQEIYAPVYISPGLTMGSIGCETAGYGRWHYILKKHLPEVFGKRILDIGANNGQNAMQLMRSGAKEIIGIEINSLTIHQGEFVRTAYEWADNKAYNFRYIQTNMNKLPDLNLGRFDLVMALCSLYYLSEDDMARIVKYVNTIADTLILQANTALNISRQDPGTYKKASLTFTDNILKSNGFPKTRVISPYGYSRPLVIGQKG